MKRCHRLLWIGAGLSCLWIMAGCTRETMKESVVPSIETITEKEPGTIFQEEIATTLADEIKETTLAETVKETTSEGVRTYAPYNERISWSEEWEYASYSVIHTGEATLYHMDSDAKTVAVNAGHGTQGVGGRTTLSHPDGSAKIVGGTNAAGAVESLAISSGTTMNSGTPEAELTLRLAMVLKNKLLDAGFNVLMIRENNDAGLDNIARTVIANQYADCHIALHYDSTQNDKGAFFIGVPDVDSYRAMEPVASHYKEHIRLGECLISGLGDAGVKIHGQGRMDNDLTQTSYSTIPSVDLEVGDRGSSESEEALSKIADGVIAGLLRYYEK